MKQYRYDFDIGLLQFLLIVAGVFVAGAAVGQGVAGISRPVSFALGAFAVVVGFWSSRRAD